MFFIRIMGIALLAALASALASARGISAQAEEFAAQHQGHCMRQPGSPAVELCALRTVQLASQLYGLEFGDQVAEALH